MCVSLSFEVASHVKKPAISAIIIIIKLKLLLRSPLSFAQLPSSIHIKFLHGNI